MLHMVDQRSRPIRQDEVKVVYYACTGCTAMRAQWKKKNKFPCEDYKLPLRKADTYPRFDLICSAYRQEARKAGVANRNAVAKDFPELERSSSRLCLTLRMC
uniref:Uncharacterized protein n=1 Tax=Ditylenchus dipsaci TaxID=166011 RepID=A0A915D8J9_9BILA